MSEPASARHGRPAWGARHGWGARHSWGAPNASGARLGAVPPSLVLLVTLATGFVIRPSPVWAMLFYLTVLPVCGWRLLRRDAWPSDAGSRTAIALMVWFTLATLWDVAAGAQVGPHVFWLWNGLCTFVMVVSARREFGAPGERRETLVTVLIAAALFNLCLVFARTLIEGVEPGGRLTGWAETRHPILGACVIGTCVVLAAGRLLQGRTRYLAAATLVGGLAFIVLTGSRGPLAAVLGALALLLALTRPGWLLASAVVLAAAIRALTMARPDLPHEVSERLLARGWSSRLDIWQLALQEIERRPLFGYGPSARLDRAVDNFPHDLFLSTLFYSGAVGLLLLLALFCLAIRASFRLPDRVSRAVGLALLLHLALAGVSDLSQVTKGPGPLWYIIWIPFILALGPPIRQEPMVACGSSQPIRDSGIASIVRR